MKLPILVMFFLLLMSCTVTAMKYRGFYTRRYGRKRTINGLHKAMARRNPVANRYFAIHSKG